MIALGGRVQQDRVGIVGFALIASLAAALLTPTAASAGSEDPHAEIFTGVEASNNAVSGYLGGGYAFGKGLYEPGWRLRAVGSLGRYDYQGSVFGGGRISTPPLTARRVSVLSSSAIRFRRGDLTLKLFAGAEAEDQDISPRDPRNSVQGSAVGFRIAGGKLVRPLARMVRLCRCRLWHRVPGVLEPCPPWLARVAQSRARA